VHALDANQFLLFAQKIQPLQGDVPDPLCYEVLLRLQEEEDHLLPPGGFIPVAERYGMLENLDRWVVRNLFSWCVQKEAADAAWRMPLYCVNLSGASIMNPEFAKFVRAELQRSRFAARSLCFEIGEQDILASHAEVRQFIDTLKPAGCRFTIDAFGSAKVSFTHLKGLAIDFIKIDGVIIQNILRDPAEFAKARAIHTVCRRLAVRTIAEFVETDETLTRLREIGIDYAQGFGIARPGLLTQQT
jgi:EAL domain-containing protein (putative c-di-GMP-specific phosphodiesterase class I)